MLLKNPSVVISVISIIFPIIASQSLTFHTPTPSIVNVGDIWQFAGFITIPAAQAPNYQTILFILIDNKLRCLIEDFTSCSTSTLPVSPVNECQCTSSSGDNYNFVFRRQASLIDSGKFVVGFIPYVRNSSANERLRETHPVRSPLIYSATLNNTAVSSGRGVDVTGATDLTVAIVLGTPYSYNLYVELDGFHVGRSTDSNVTFNTPASGQSTVKITVEIKVTAEIGGLSDSFEFEIIDQNPLTTTTLATNIDRSTSTVISPVTDSEDHVMDKNEEDNKDVGDVDVTTISIIAAVGVLLSAIAACIVYRAVKKRRASAVENGTVTTKKTNETKMTPKKGSSAASLEDLEHSQEDGSMDSLSESDASTDDED